MILTLLLLLVNGQGYEKIGSTLDYKLQSTNRNPHPMAISGINPILIQLDPEYLLDSPQFVEITLASQIVLSGLSIQTPEANGLKSFKLEYADLDMEYPNNPMKMIIPIDAYTLVKTSRSLVIYDKHFKGLSLISNFSFCDDPGGAQTIDSFKPILLVNK